MREFLIKKRIIIFIFTTLGAILGVCIFNIGGPVREARQSCQVLSKFAGHVRHGEWAKAQDMLETDPEWFRIEDEKVLYWNHDITSQMADAKPNFWKTLEYYRTDRHMGEKVIFRASSRADYAKLKDGRITFVKMP